MFTALKKNNPNHAYCVPVQGFPAARAQPVAAITRAELSRAVLSLPLAFQRTEAAIHLVAIMGLSRDRNLFVTQDNRWAGSYVPAAFRAYPFALGKTPEGTQVVCIDEESGCLRQAPGEGARELFTRDGEPGPFLNQLVQFLRQVNADLEATGQSCAVLDQHGLLEDWPLKIKSQSGEQTLSGFLRVNEAKLNELEPAALAEVRNAGALPIAFGQLYAMGHLATLGKLAEAHAKAAEAMRQKMRDSASMFEEPEITFNFD